ncbi:MAG: hypothetical protein RLZZ584_453 [Pseudomonadota bacterium]
MPASTMSRCRQADCSPPPWPTWPTWRTWPVRAGRRLASLGQCLLLVTALQALAGPAAAQPQPQAMPQAQAAAVPRPAPRAVAASAAGARPANAPAQRGQDAPLLAPDIARIVARGELVVAMLGTDSPPFFATGPDGEPEGLEVDMARELARELKVEVRFLRSAANFNQVVEVVARREADLGISKLSRTLARAQMIRFSDPYLRLNHALALNRLAFAKLALDQPVASVVRNFTGSIGVIANSSFATYAARNFPHASIKSYKKWDDAVAAVNSGEVVGVYRDEFEIKRLVKSDPVGALKLRTVTLKDQEDTLGIAVGIGDPVLLAFVNQFIAQRNERLDVDKVLQRAFARQAAGGRP